MTQLNLRYNFHVYACTLSPYTLFLMWTEEEAVNLKKACDFLILIPHTEVKKQRTEEFQDLAEKLSDDPAARCLHASDWH